MGIFNFKNKRKAKDIESMIKKSVNDYSACLERYKHLKNNELANIPDDNLENAVMSWMWNKFNKDWSNQYEVITSLPKPCQDVYSCRTVSDEIDNGGFNQLFYNSTGEFTEMAREGFVAIGSPKLSGIMDNAIRAYKDNKAVLDKYDDGKLESFCESYSEEIFNKLDDEFYKEECELRKLIIEHIRKNADCFGD